MKDILEDIETRMFALDRALPGNTAARDLLEILHRSQVEIGNLREGLLEIRRRLAEMPGVTCGMADVIDHALPSVSQTPESSES